MKSFIDQTTTVSKINVTPIIDVALVLVIILMVTAPVISMSDVDIELPPAHTRGLEGADRITLTVGRAGELAIDDQNVSQAQFASVLQERLAANADAVLVVRADMSVPYEAVENLIADARTLGATRIAIGTRQRGTIDE